MMVEEVLRVAHAGQRIPYGSGTRACAGRWHAAGMGQLHTVGILDGMPLETTIKIDRELRDRLNAAAKQQRMTPSQLIEVLLGEYEQQRWVEAAVAEMRAAPQEVWDEYLREAESMDGSLMDGLEDEPPYPKPQWMIDFERDHPGESRGKV